ncbi:MAG TPA: response regulator transcription factor [Pyrinomonadaceae bacterium]|jgi:DNA-binding NarL/FixJ family response regulator|nr:response regulator transcription factor [Pyrinomonadaceae bacterium]
MNKLRILLAEDHETIRDGLKLLVNSQPDMEIVGEAENGRVALQLAQELLPDVVVMDVSMPELNGLQATKKLKQKCPQVKVLTLTRHTDDGYLQQLLQAGASGYVLKQSKSAELLRAIRAVVNGQTYLDPAITEKAVTQIRGGKRASRGSSPDANLSDRETEVLRLIAWGYINKEIAARLNLSVKTVEVHKANGMRKMGMKSRVDIVRYALLQGWLQDS